MILRLKIRFNTNYHAIILISFRTFVTAEFIQNATCFGVKFFVQATGNVNIRRWSWWKVMQCACEVVKFWRRVIRLQLHTIFSLHAWDVHSTVARLEIRSVVHGVESASWKTIVARWIHFRRTVVVSSRIWRWMEPEIRRVVVVHCIGSLRYWVVLN